MVSFIVPVYNMERYVERCLDSIVGQGGHAWEIVAVDDGSTDRTPQILDRYGAEDSRIRIVHKENGGIGSAIRAGLELINGDYVAFVDSDDYLEQDMLDTLAPYLGRYDIIQFGMVEEDEEGRTLGRIGFAEEEATGPDILVRYFESYRMPSLACRLFRRELFKGIRIPGRNIGIDEMATLQLMGGAKSLISLEAAFYHIYVRGGSVSRAVYSRQRIDETMEVHGFLWDYVKDLSRTVKNYVLIKNMQAYLGMFAFCEGDIFPEERERISRGIRDWRDLARREGDWRQIRRQLGMGYRLYALNSGCYRRIQLRRRG